MPRISTTALLLLILLLGATPSFAQTNPEVFLGDLKVTNQGLSVTNLQNISNNPGYDNQPSFLADNSGVLIASTRDAQTDIALYDIKSKQLHYLFETPSFSEYSPVQMPDRRDISFIILAEDGTQQFWKSSPGKKKPDVIESDDVIGYYAWFDNDSYLCFVLPTENKPTTLQFHNRATGEKKELGENPGRSIHKIPGKDALSFLNKNHTPWLIQAYYPKTDSLSEITNVPFQMEDMAWTPSGSIVMGNGNTLSIWTDGKGWSKEMLVFEKDGTISRLAVSPDGKKIAIVFEEK